MAAPVPYGAALTVAGKVGAWIVNARAEERESRKIIRHALRGSICRFDPYAPGVDELAGAIEEKMWDLAKTMPRKGFRGRLDRFRAKLPWVGKHVKSEALDFPHWRRELTVWVEAALERVPLTAAREQIGCRAFPEDRATLAERFPTMFRLAHERTDEMATFHRDLLTRLKEANELKASLTGEYSKLWAPLVGAVAAGAVGLGVAEILHWADPELIAAGSLTVGGVLGWITAKKPKPTERQAQLRNLVAQWVASYLRFRTGARDGEHPQLMLQTAIEQESAERHRSAPHTCIPFDEMVALRGVLGNLTRDADAAGEGHVAAEMRRLDEAFDHSEAGFEPEGTVLPALQLLMFALEAAPPQRAGETPA
jgi:hypothetical protein